MHDKSEVSASTVVNTADLEVVRKYSVKYFKLGWKQNQKVPQQL